MGFWGLYEGAALVGLYEGLLGGGGLKKINVKLVISHCYSLGETDFVSDISHLYDWGLGWGAL